MPSLAFATPILPAKTEERRESAASHLQGERKRRL